MRVAFKDKIKIKPERKKKRAISLVFRAASLAGTPEGGKEREERRGKERREGGRKEMHACCAGLCD